MTTTIERADDAPRPAAGSVTPGPRIPVTTCHILVVDDTEFNRTLLGAVLREAGYIHVAFARNGLEALEAIARRTPDLVILDIMMPGMDGFEVCRRLRADHTYADLPVLVQTALSSGEDRNRAFAAGTTDLIAKPIDRSELLARVRIHLENLLMIRDLQLYRQRVEAELDVARSMYEHLLPSPARCAGLGRPLGLDIRGYTTLSSETGGQVWGVIPLSGARLGVFLLDTPGHGVTAALNAFSMHTLIQETVPHAGDPGTFLTALNARAAGVLGAGERTSVLYGVIDTGADRLLWATAASPAPVVAMPHERPRRAAVADNDGNNNRGDDGPAIGTPPDTRFATRSHPFPAGSRLILHSHGVDRALWQNSAGSRQPLVEAVLRDGRDDPFTALAAVVAAAGGDQQDEDRSLVWVARGPAA